MDIESRLRTAAQLVPGGHLRTFGCKCCERLLPLFSESVLQELLSLGQTRSVREVDANDIRELRLKSMKVFESLYPGYGDPSSASLAISAVGELAFTDSSLVAAINSAELA